MSRPPQSLLRYTLADSEFGPIVVVASPRGLCALRYVEKQAPAELEAALRREYPAAEVRRDDAGLRPLVRQVNDVLSGRLDASEVPLDLQGTPFQVRVWQELVKVPWGATITYSELAARAGRPAAIRAVASCCARNRIALLVPCHRIVAKGGGLGGYYYGLDRKRRLLEREGALFV
jgi:AraC family transcriptional regulator of adaptative response/methylated-DNA-[protein]-cysteine methyltransferase